MTDWKKWRGLKSLVQDAVEHGASAIERVHTATAARPFAVVEHFVGEPAKLVHQAHDVIVKGTYANVRVVNRAVGATLDAVIDVLEERHDKAAEEAPASANVAPDEI